MKAVILESRGGRAAALMNDGTVRVIRGAYRVGDVITWHARAAWRRWAAAAAALAVLIGGGGYVADQNLVACAEISLDVNPSIVYTVNKRDRVLSVSSVGDEGVDLAEALRSEGVRFMPVETAIEKTLALLEEEGYIDSDAEVGVLANVSCDDENRREALAGAVEAALEATVQDAQSVEWRVDRSDRATAREAAENGMSVGRYAAWRDAQERGEDAADLANYADMPVRDILDRNGNAAPEEASGPEPARSTPSAAESDAQPERADGKDADVRTDETAASEPASGDDRAAAPHQPDQPDRADGGFEADAGREAEGDRGDAAGARDAQPRTPSRRDGERNSSHS